MTEQAIAERLEKLFEYNGERTIFTRQALTDRSEDQQRLSDLIHASDVGEDTAYSEVVGALDTLSTESTEDIEDCIWDYCEPDVYTSDLMEWAQIPANRGWCDEAMSEGVAGDSLASIIAAGQQMAKVRVWEMVIELVRELADEENDEEFEDEL